VNIIIGMDAGWAVEGAVGSEYKIDATYLSPHVNMASRMMSAAKQYGVTILLSQAVEALLSIPARNKLRHLDTVYVKGSSVSQRIFTYDARQSGVDFFLFERSPEQADLDAENYHPAIWDTDQDLCAMRNHVTEDFLRKFNEGRNLYLAGEWMEAVEALKEADEIMTTTILEEGYLDFFEDDMKRQGVDDARRLRGDLGDGPSKCLISYMEKRNSVAPENWMGVRPLTSK
jgi:Adenylate and Guanylate cyclase catalytic domain